MVWTVGMAKLDPSSQGALQLPYNPEMGEYLGQLLSLAWPLQEAWGQEGPRESAHMDMRILGVKWG